MREGPEGILIEAPWFRARHAVGTALLALLLGGVGVLSVAGWRLLGPASVLFLNLFTPVLLGLLYVGLAGLLNRSTLRCSRREGAIAVEHGPIPWPRPPALPTGEVEELAVARRSRVAGLLADFAVAALLRNGDHRAILLGLASAAEAEVVVRALSAHLGLGRPDPFDA